MTARAIQTNYRLELGLVILFSSIWFSPFPVPCRYIILCSPAAAVLHPPPNSKLSLFSSRSTSHHACLLPSQLILIVQSAGPTFVDTRRNGSRLPPLSEKEGVEKSQWLRVNPQVTWSMVHHPPVPSDSPPSHGDTRPFMFKKKIIIIPIARCTVPLISELPAGQGLVPFLSGAYCTGQSCHLALVPSE